MVQFIISVGASLLASIILYVALETVHKPPKVRIRSRPGTDSFEFSNCNVQGDIVIDTSARHTKITGNTFEQPPRRSRAHAGVSLLVAVVVFAAVLLVLLLTT